MIINPIIEDLLVEFDELDMQPMIPMPGDPIEKARAWKSELIEAIQYQNNEVADEVLMEVSNLLLPLTSLPFAGKMRMAKNFKNEFDSFMEKFVSLRKKYI